MIKAIIFDNVGVFTDKGLSCFLDRVVEKYHVDREEFEFEYKKMAKIANTGEITANQLYADLINHFKLDASVQEMRDLHLGSYKKRRVEMFEFAKELAEEFDICLFSNFNDAFDELNGSLKLEEVFAPERIFVSAKIHLKKPSMEAFQYVLDKISCSPNEVVFVDDREDNFKEPKAMGIHGILFKDFNQFKKDFLEIIDKNNKIFNKE